MNEIILHSFCKVNLNLLITKKRMDGWHELSSVFCPLDEPHDTMHLRQVGQGIKVFCDFSGIDPKNNTLIRAYEAFAEFSAPLPGVEIELKKGVPSGMGLGGGSANAAALLIWLNTQADKPLKMPELIKIALKVGADVPFFLHGIASHNTGLGEIMHPINLLRYFSACPFMLLICPKVQVSTPWAYAAFDKKQLKDKLYFLTDTPPQDISLNRLSARKDAVENKVSGSNFLLINDFEQIVFAAYPLIRRCKELLLQNGAVAAVMSGSGAAVLGLFRDSKILQEAREQTKSQLEHDIIGLYAYKIDSNKAHCMTEL